jgi:hypothetical protein
MSINRAAQNFPTETTVIEQDDTLDCQGVCKDCGNGTLNNRLNEAFDYNGNGVYCLDCGSSHVDIL